MDLSKSRYGYGKFFLINVSAVSLGHSLDCHFRSISRTPFISFLCFFLQKA